MGCKDSSWHLIGFKDGRLYTYANRHGQDAAAELGRNPVSKHQILPELRDEQDDAGRNCRTRLARLNSYARTRTEK